jgi:apolipoprotein N-acyltransferase
LKGKKIIIFISSFFIVAFGQPAWVGVLSPLAAIFGYAFFWYGFYKLDIAKKLKISFIWYFLVQAVQLSWMSSIKYQGPYILLVYLFLLIALSFQFIVLTYFVYSKKATLLHGLFISSIWTIFEWLRLFFISGFSWNPAAMAYSNYYLSMQIASIAGVLGVSFYVIFGNFVFYRFLIYKKKVLSLILVALAPYLFGICYFYLRNNQNVPTLNALLVQTALLPDEKDGYLGGSYCFSQNYQWQRILIFLKNNKEKLDLILLPEVAVPGESNRYSYMLDNVKDIWNDVFGKDSTKNFPPLIPEYAFLINDKYWLVNNKFWAKAVSNHFNANVIIGMEEIKEDGKNFNSALFFNQNDLNTTSYTKRILVPIGEYFPFEWCRNIAKRLGILDNYMSGDKSVIFSGVTDIAASICYEETFGNLIREGKLLDAKLFVSIANDVWFPDSKLPLQHFHHGKLRAVENGVPLLRSCNTGITGGVDCFGRIIKILQSDIYPIEKIKGTLFVKVPLQNFKTLYTFVGDGFIVGISFLCSFLILKYSKLNRT